MTELDRLLEELLRLSRTPEPSSDWETFSEQSRVQLEARAKLLERLKPYEETLSGVAYRERLELIRVAERRWMNNLTTGRGEVGEHLRALQTAIKASPEGPSSLGGKRQA